MWQKLAIFDKILCKNGKPCNNTIMYKQKTYIFQKCFTKTFDIMQKWALKVGLFRCRKFCFSSCCIGRSQPKTWDGVELEKLDFIGLKLAHNEKNRRISVLYECIFS